MRLTIDDIPADISNTARSRVLDLQRVIDLWRNRIEMRTAEGKPCNMEGAELSSLEWALSIVLWSLRRNPTD